MAHSSSNCVPYTYAESCCRLPSPVFLRPRRQSYMLPSPCERGIDSMSEPIASILMRDSHGDAEARNALFELLYTDLRRRAHAELANHSGNTLSTTALVHEAYLKLFDKELKIESRAHFFRLAARVMRQVLIDHVRTRDRFKRGGAFVITSLDNTENASAGTDQFPLI